MGAEAQYIIRARESKIKSKQAMRAKQPLKRYSWTGLEIFTLC